MNNYKECNSIDNNKDKYIVETLEGSKNGKGIEGDDENLVIIWQSFWDVKQDAIDAAMGWIDITIKNFEFKPWKTSEYEINSRVLFNGIVIWRSWI